jgi:hypothetical protein
MLLERGDVFFFYRPRIGVDEVRRLDDVQRFFLVLEPSSDAAPKAVRLPAPWNVGLAPMSKAEADPDPVRHGQADVAQPSDGGGDEFATPDEIACVRGRAAAARRRCAPRG